MASQPPNDDGNNLFNNIINRITNFSNTYIAPGGAQSGGAQSEFAPIAPENYIGMPEPANARLARNLTAQQYTRVVHNNITIDEMYDSTDEDMPDLIIEDDDVGGRQLAAPSPVSTGGAVAVSTGGAMHNIGGTINYFSPISFMSASSIPINSSTIRFDDLSRIVTIPINTVGASGGSTVDSVIQRSFNNDKDNYKHVLADDADILKSVPYSTVETEETECSIMKEPFEPDTMVVQLPCKHVFCHEAIKHWLETESATCPVCRHKLPSKEIKNEEEESIRPIQNTDMYRSLIQHINEIRTMREQQDIQQAIFNSLV